MTALILANATSPIFAILIVVVFGFGIAIYFLLTAIVICGPNEVLILSGRAHPLPDGSVVGYRVIRGGRAIRFPFLESLAGRISLTPQTVCVQLPSALAKGGSRVDLEFEAQVRVSARDPELTNAIERFLGHTIEEVGEVARNTLEGHLRTAAGNRSPEELQHLDERSLREVFKEGADDDLAKIGLELVSVSRFRVQPAK